ncbi:MAG: hypothetical protein U1A28_02875 [Patescibacteria group bacterium]|nr:hypothetical protein [Patescibacteria group bacterium]
MAVMYRRQRLLGALSVLLLGLMPLPLAAAPVLRSGESVTVTDTQEVPDDFYAVGGAVTISGTIRGDLYAAAGTVTINGEITEDAVIVGGSTHVAGSVAGDVRLASGELIIAGTVGGDVLVMGGVVHVLSTARIDGDLLFFGGEIIMDGDLRGSLSGQAKAVRINGPIRGVVSVTAAQALELGDQAQVEGSVEYASSKDIVRAPGSVVIGDITKKELSDTSDTASFSILPLLALLFTTLVYMLLCKTRLEYLMRHTIGAFGWHGLLGFGVLLLAPVVAAILSVSIIGLPVGAALLLLYLLFLLVAFSLGGIFVGALFARYFDGKVTVSLKWTLLGTVIFALVLYIPYIGLPLALIVCLAVIGGMTTILYARIRT